MKILVLAGGTDQIALIKELKSRGHEVILVDYFENPPAKRYADKHVVASTLDIQLVEAIAKQEKVDMICTACTDQALLTVAKVSESLKLPSYIDYQTALNVTNKSFMKKVLSESNIPTAKFLIVEHPGKKEIKNFRYPLVVKPVDCNSSKGVIRIDKESEIDACVKNAISLSRTKTAIIEEFKTGEEVSADFYVEGVNAKLLSATKSFKIKDRKSFTILGSEYPVLDEKQEIRIVSIANQIVRAFKLKDTPLLVQFIMNGNDFSVIEFSPRMGGGSKYRLIEKLSGVKIMSKYVDRILGGKPTVSPSKRVGYCKMMYIYSKPGKIKKVDGFDKLMDQDIVEDYFVYKTEGMTITKAETSSDRIAGYLVMADSEKNMNAKISIADSSLKVLNEKNEDIMIHDLH